MSEILNVKFTLGNGEKIAMKIKKKVQRCAQK